MYYIELSDIQRRNMVDLRQVYESYSYADKEMSRRFSGSMSWKVSGGAEYLKRKINGVEKSLGRRSPETEAMYQAFMSGREEQKKRVSELASAMDAQAAISRAAGLGRVPLISARIIRELIRTGIDGSGRVVGTNALFAYEALAGVHFKGGLVSTGDIDLLLDVRQRLRIVAEEKEAKMLIGILQKVDRSFEKIPGKPYRASNSAGFMVDIIRPQPRPAWNDEKHAKPLSEDDLSASPIEGLQWLLNSKRVEVIAVDEKGYPVPMACSDPRIWALHKVWLSNRKIRDPMKKQRDLNQAVAVAHLIADHLPQWHFYDNFINDLPAALKAGINMLDLKNRDDGASTIPKW